MKKYKIGLSSCGKPLNEETFKSFAEAGIDAIEISQMPQYGDLSSDFLDFKEIKELSEKWGIELWSFHLPFIFYPDIPKHQPEPSLWSESEYTINYFEEFIEKASNIGIDKFIVHPSFEPITYDEREDRIKCSCETLSKLADVAAKYDSVIAVEDLPRTCLGNTSDEILRLISLNSKLGVCLDTNHLLMESNKNFIEKVKDRIITIHVSDYDYLNERHWLPGEGKVNWSEVLDSLEAINYNGVWMYEIEYKCPNTINRSRDLMPADFVRNANELFEGKKPTIIS